METDTPVTEIAQNCGLGSSSYFGRLLRQETGLSPLAYRAKMAGSYYRQAEAK